MNKLILILFYMIPAIVFGASASQNWEAHLNDFFGQYIVSPLAALLFWPILQSNASSSCLVIGRALFFTIKMRFVNIRMFKHAFKLVFSKQVKMIKKW